MARQKLSPEQIADLKDRWKAGEPAVSLAKAFGVVRQVVYYHCADLEHAYRRRERDLAPRDAEIRKAFADGKTIRQLAEEYELSSPRVSQICHGIAAALRHPQLSATTIQRDYMTAGDAAAELGISRFTMHEYLTGGKFPGAFQIGEKGRFWLVPRAAVLARKKAKAA